MMKRKSTPPFHNQRGFSLVETLVGLGIMVSSGLAIVTTILVVRGVGVEIETRSSEEKQIMQIVENIRTAPENFQIAFVTGDQDKETLLKPETLPMAWGNNMVAEASECEGCPGRFGYIVQPFQGMRGLYVVTLRMTHASWKEPTYKDFEFVVSAR